MLSKSGHVLVSKVGQAGHVDGQELTPTRASRETSSCPGDQNALVWIPERWRGLAVAMALPVLSIGRGPAWPGTSSHALRRKLPGQDRRLPHDNVMRVVYNEITFFVKALGPRRTDALDAGEIPSGLGA